MSFISTEDVRKRLGLAALTSTQRDQIEVLLGLVDGLIFDAVDQDQAWADALRDDVPPMLRAVEMTVVCRALANPTGASGLTEMLGQYSHSERFNDASEAGLSLTDREERLSRRAVYGTDAGGGQAESLATDLEPGWTAGGAHGLSLDFFPE